MTDLTAYRIRSSPSLKENWPDPNKLIDVNSAIRAGCLNSKNRINGLAKYLANCYEQLTRMNYIRTVGMSSQHVV